ncbi:hypothetical protein BN903_65 [Halorubrum sp. AJ67]|nr:hypothetical protein BN903_65 [Halorubrum sp. AJ67]
MPSKSCSPFRCLLSVPPRPFFVSPRPFFVSPRSVPRPGDFHPIAFLSVDAERRAVASSSATPNFLGRPKNRWFFDVLGGPNIYETFGRRPRRPSAGGDPR